MNPMTAILIVLSLSVAAGDKVRDKPAPEEQYKALVKDFNQAANLTFNATTDEERTKQVARAIKLAPRLLELVEKHPKDMRKLERQNALVKNTRTSGLPLSTDALSAPAHGN